MSLFVAMFIASSASSVHHSVAHHSVARHSGAHHSGAAAVAVLIVLSGVAFAQMGSPCGGMGWSGQGQPPASQVSPDKAKQVAQQYADQYPQRVTVNFLIAVSFPGVIHPIEHAASSMPGANLRVFTLLRPR